MNCIKFGHSCAVCLGITAITLQIVLTREFFAVFYGNELCIGILLAVWLVWVAVGSRLGVFLTRYEFFKNPQLFPVLQTGSILAGIGAAILIRFVRVFLAVPPAEYISFVELVGFALPIFAVPCLLVGLQFAHLAGSAQSRGIITNDQGAVIYIFEAAGSAIGGIAVSLVALLFFTNLQVLFLFGALSALFFLWCRVKWSLAPAFLFLLLFILPQARRLEFLVVQKYWQSFHKDMQLVEWRQSRFSELSVIKWSGEKTLYSNSAKQTLLPDPLGAQELAALALVQHPQPGQILLIGGGLGGAAAELARSSHAQVVYVELDRQAFTLALAQYDSVQQSAFKQGNLHIAFTDGRAYLNAGDGEFDIIIINIGKPATAAANRYYTAEFFQLTRSRLAAGGVLAICGFPAAENYFGPELLQLNAGLYALLRENFSDVLALPGDNAWYFAATDTVTLTRDPEAMSARFEQQGLSFDYFYPQMYWQYALPYRLDQLELLLTNTTVNRLNRDFTPVSWYYDFVLWNKLVRGHSVFFTKLAAIDYLHVLFFSVIVFCLLFIIMLLRKSRGASQGGIIILTVFFGLASITVNIILLLTFQVIFGYIYEWLGIIMGLFMAGMALASRLMYGWSKKADSVLLLSLLLIVTVLLLFFMPLISTGIQNTRTIFGFIILVIFSGAITGGGFPLLSGICNRLTGRLSAGVIYASDLAGAAAGSCLMSGFFIPLYGFFKTLLWIAVIGLVLILYWFFTNRLHFTERNNSI